MPIIVSQLELLGSPFEQASWQVQTWYWDPSDALQPGELIASVSLNVIMYDPYYPEDVTDVSATVLDPASPFIGTGDQANQLGFTVLAHSLLPGYNYRCQMSANGDQGSTPAAFSVVKCVV